MNLESDDLNSLFEFYCLSHKNEERKKSMEERFKKLDIPCNFYEGIDSSLDERTKKYNFNSSCMYGHLDMIHQFYNNTNKPYGIFCEDDILIHIHLKEYLLKIIPFFNDLNLDVLLIGYLLSHPIYKNSLEFFEIPIEKTMSDEFPFKFYKYCDDLWGAQMYMLSRENAKKILDKYYVNYIEEYNNNSNITPFSADWTITKDGNRAMIFPLLVIEDGKKKYDDFNQQKYHSESFLSKYIENIHI